MKLLHSVVNDRSDRSARHPHNTFTMAYFLRCAGSILSLMVALSCSAGKGSSTERPQSGGGQTGGAPGSGGTLNVGVGGTSAGGTINLGGTASGGSAGVEACATETAQATLTSEPIDILLVLDNSGSMQEEMQAIEENITASFAEILNAAGVDYRVILLSRHRVGQRGPFDDDDYEQANTSICVTQPLSGLAACPAELPVFTERFYQWSEKIESFDALNWLIDGWNEAPENDDFRDLAPNGYSPFLRPDAKKAIVVMTDDDESNDDTPATLLTVDSFLEQFTALSPEQFGTATTPSFRFHSIVGLAEKTPATAPYTPDEPLVETECASNNAVIESHGPTYQNLSIRTGGLRFPLCQFPGYGAVLEAIAGDVIVQAILACDFPIPEPPAGKTLELEKVAVQHIRADGSEAFLGQAPTSADCQADAFYIESDRVWLCPQACDAIKAENGANVNVLFTCESQIIVPH
jgi:hypothetical protein